MDFYLRYLECCNERRFDELGEFVAEDVSVNGAKRGLERYTAGLRAVVEAFPDYRWELQQLLVDGDRLAARLTDTGTQTGTFLDVPPTGQTISVQELAMYQLHEGRIVECWGDLGFVVRDRLTNGTIHN